MKPALHAARTAAERTLVVLDEIHHAGDALTWGDGVREAFERRHPAPGADRHAVPLRHRADPVRHLRRPTTTGSAARSPTTPTATATRCATAWCARCSSCPTRGRMRWRTRAGDEVAAALGDETLTKDLTAQAWRTALDPAGEWIPAVLAAADVRLTEVRRTVPGRRRPGDRLRPGRRPRLRHPPARDHRRARHRGALRRRRRLGPDRGVRRRRRRAGWSRSGWSPRGSTCRACRSGSTPPRRPRRCSSPRRSAGSCGPGGAARPRRCSCPACPQLLALAAEPRARARPRPGPAERRGPRAAAGRGAARGAAPPTRWSRAASRARSRRWRPRPASTGVLFDGGEFGVGRGRRLGRGGRLPRPARAARAGPGRDAAAPATRGAHRRAGRCRARRPRSTTGASPSCARSSTRWSGRGRDARGQPHGSVHTELRRRCGGPEVALASADAARGPDGPGRRWFVGRG